MRVDDCDIAAPGGYIYAIISPSYQAVYIGQTAGYQGAIGRLSQHLSYGVSNTFRQRICRVYSLEVADIGPIDFAARRLGSHKTFHEKAADYREAVEFLTQYRIIDVLTSERLPFGVVSRVTANRYTRLTYVKNEADAVTSSLLSWMRQFVAKT